MSLIGQTIGAYRILEELGRGGMGTVYRAMHISQGYQVALKVLAPELARNTDFARRFPREMEVMRQLNHRHIVRLVDAGQAQGVLYMAMELMEAGSLDRLLANGQTLDLFTVVNILGQMASALDYAHQRQVIHRDVKPSNILFARDGRAVLTDFGIAKVAGQTTSLTQTGAVIGTPEYVSPEQAQGTKELDGRSDIYSLGVVAYQMLTGRVPFRRENPWATMLAHINEAPPPLRHWNTRISPEVERVVLRSLVKAPSQRYASADQFAQALLTASRQHVAPSTPLRLVLGATAMVIAVMALFLVLMRQPSTATSLPPSGAQLLAFESDQNGNREIYVADPLSQRRWLLASSPAQDFGPAWSPNGQRLAFASDRGGFTDLYVVDRQSQALTALTQDPAVDSGPAWSPDGRFIAFDSDRSGNVDVWVMEASGSNLRSLTDHPAFDGDPAWSPDGQWIAFESDRDGNFEIYVMPAVGGTVRRLTTDSGRDFAPSWSPDGLQIVFECERQSAEICVMDSGGGSVRRLTVDNIRDQQPSWSPDGRIIWTRRQGLVWNLYTMDAAGQNVRPWQITAWSETAPAWSP